MEIVTKSSNKRTKKRSENKKNLPIASLVDIICVIAMVGLIAYALLHDYPAKSQKGYVITRNLDFSEGSFWIRCTDDISTRTVAWDSELPSFVEEDLKSAQKHLGYYIKYFVGVDTINIFYDNAVPTLTVEESQVKKESAEEEDDDSSFEPLHNFSIYRNSFGNGIVVCGYTENNSFVKYTLDGDMVEKRTLTTDVNVPFDYAYQSYDPAYGSQRYGDYTLCESENVFKFYKDGKVVSSKSFNDKIRYCSLEKGIIITKNGLLYQMYAFNKDGIPDLTFVFVDDIEDIYYSQYWSGELDWVTSDGEVIEEKFLPLLQVYNPLSDVDRYNPPEIDEYYVLVPENIVTYMDYSYTKNLMPYKKNLNYRAKLVPLKEVFKTAKFNYKGMGIYTVTMYFEINGSMFSIEKEITGYDPNADVDYFAIEMHIDVIINDGSIQSFDDVKEAIKKIRTLYSLNYSNY